MTISVGYLQELAVPARFDRGLVADMFRGGVVRDGDLRISSGGGRISSIAKGPGYIPGTDNVDQGTYRLFNDNIRSLTHDAAVSYSRVDQMIAYVQDTDEGGASDAGFIAIAKGSESNGTQASDPTAPNYRAGAVIDSSLPHNFIRLADIVVPPGPGAIPGGNFIDRRTSALNDGRPGDIKPSARSTPELGWILCDGRAISRADNADLFAAIGTAWGVGNGSSTFNVPDLRGRTPIGAGTGSPGLSARALGQALGEEEHVLIVGELPKHAHDIQRSNTAASSQGTDTSSVYKPQQGSGTDYVATNLAGSDFSHNNMQPSTVVSFFIRA